MPFTPSHIAAALPFVRSPLPVAPLVIGTMAPDVPYYVPLGIPRSLTHSVIGVPTADLAITVILVLLWYTVLRPPIVDLSPAFVRERIPMPLPVAWRAPHRTRLAAVALGLAAALIGIVTHLAWDAFTHRSSPLVQAVPALHTAIGPLKVSSWLQHASTIGGLIAIAVWAWFWMRRVPRRASRGGTGAAARTGAWVVVVLAFVIAGCVAWIRGIMLGVDPFAPDLVFLGATVAGGVAGVAGMLICAAWWIARAVRTASA